MLLLIICCFLNNAETAEDRENWAVLEFNIGKSLERFKGELL
ncbi:hypothetical protein R0011_12108 [Lacticaseibacillus rhamnosus R0011]|nr:hypothetical protein R0011_12108 [Lacticaseibacillus rhamnosus R0011]EHJ27417.1 hypothetical protein HMPREF0541_02542 [Lacticaseibacillus rhamnosus ATCC 21052]